MTVDAVRQDSKGISATVQGWMQLALWVAFLGVVIVLVNGRFSTVDRRFDDMNGRLDRIEERNSEDFDEMKERLDRIMHLLSERGTQSGETEP